MLLFSVISLVVFTVLMPFFTGLVPVSIVPQLMSDQINLFIHGPLREEFIIPDTPDSITSLTSLQTTPTADRIDLLHDFETLVQQNKQHAKQQVIEMYNQYVPAQVSEYVNTSFSYWQTHSSYKVYKDHESLINNVLLFLGALIVLKLIISAFQFIFGTTFIDEFDDEGDESENTQTIWDKQGNVKPQYTKFETMPLCVGKAEAEEDLIMNSYKNFRESESKILQQLSQLPMTSTPEIVEKREFQYTVLDGSTPRQSTPEGSTPPTLELGSPLTVKHQKVKYASLQQPSPQEPIKSILTQETTTTTSSSISAGTPRTDTRFSSSSSPRSISPEDSFEREERVLDKSLSRLNDQVSKTDSERPYTPSKLSISSSVEYSPSKKLIYKKSSAILAVNPVSVAESTVGDITEEIVYSGPFKIDIDSSSSELLTPIRDNMRE